jgi:hypothetical protein
MAMFVGRLAALYNAWDRLDYKEACSLVSSLPPVPESSRFWDARWLRFIPGQAVPAWITNLAAPCPAKTEGRWSQDACILMAAHTRELCADLLANGERRLRDKQFEDANLRAYRIAKMIGQVRLFEQGYDSSALDPQDSSVKEFQTYLQKHRQPLSSQGKYLVMGRQQTYRFLKRLGDRFWERLQNLEQSAAGSDQSIESRNRSILIHGFQPLAIHEEQTLRSTYHQLEVLLIEDGGAAAERSLNCARFLNFGFNL